MQKTIEDLFAALDSPEFSGVVSPDSSLTGGIDAIRASEPVVKLMLLSRNSSKAYHMVLEQLGAYLDRPVDEQYESPWDVQISALLLIVLEVDPVVGNFVSLSLISSQTLWWAKGIALSYQLGKVVSGQLDKAG